MIVLGIDPGGAHTGIVLRDRDELIGWQLLERDGQPIFGWCNRVVDVAGGLVANLRLDLVAVEDLNDPTPQMGTTSVRGLIDTAHVIGALIGWAGDPAAGAPCLLVPPGGHGAAATGLGRAGLLAAYPAELVGAREHSGAGRLRHVRSAYDVAGAAAKQRRMEVG